MDSAKVRLTIPEHIDPTRITGTGDALLRAVEANTSASVVVRGNAISLAGTPDVASLPALKVKGNRPYKQGGASTFCPTGDASLCTGCLTCVRLCPAEAISAADPCATDAAKCMACGRCIVVCPHGARMFRGDAYAAFGTKFVAAFSARKEPEMFFGKVDGGL